MNLIGLDVGFSVERPSSGVARLNWDGGLLLGHTASSWESRRSVIGAERADVAAIDAPYTVAGPAESRDCERVFTLGKFQRRCKPGLSHVRGTGARLRAAGWEAAHQLGRITPNKGLVAPFPRVADFNVVEAFPNAYLGVCVGSDVYETRPRLRRGQKFDWLYDRWLEVGLFRRLLPKIGAPQLADLGRECDRNLQHDERAALVCLLTAAGVFTGNYTAVGEESGGYFFLPPWSMWASWAQEELDRQRARLPGLEVWIDGRCLLIRDELPVHS